MLRNVFEIMEVKVSIQAIPAIRPNVLRALFNSDNEINVFKGF